MSALCVCSFVFVLNKNLVLVLFCVPGFFADCGRRRPSDWTLPPPQTALTIHTCTRSLILSVVEGRGDNRTGRERRGAGTQREEDRWKEGGQEESG